MAKLFTALLGATALCAGSAAYAAADIVDFTNPAGDVGSSSHTYTDTSGTLSVSATGYDSSGGSKTNLYGKSLGNDEVGLGLTADPAKQDEIYKGAFVQLDLSNLVGKVSAVNFNFESTTGGEEWAVYGSGTAGTLGSMLFSGKNDESPYNLLSALGTKGLSSYKYYDFASLGTNGKTAGNVLLGNLTLVPSVPEPATWAMMLVGFGAMGAAFRRNRKQLSLTQVA